MRRGSLAAVVAGAVLAAVWAAPAFAHATFPDLTSVPADADQTILLNVPEEIDAINTGVEIFIPTGWQALSCVSPQLWQCQLVPAAGTTPASIRWTKDPGTQGSQENFTFSVHTAPPGVTSAFPVTQTYSDGTVIQWNGPPDSEEPAPRLQTEMLPPPVIPEVATPVLLPLGAITLLGGATLLSSRRRRAVVHAREGRR